MTVMPVVASDAEGRPLRRSPLLVAGVLSLAGCFSVLSCSRGLCPSAFVAPSQTVASPAGPWVAGTHAERMQVPRGEAEPLTQMHGQYPDRSRKNAQGGGRLPIKVNRNPVLGYSVGGDNEPAFRTANRMVEMMDVDYSKMVQERSRYFRPVPRKRKFTLDWKMRKGRRDNERRLKQQFDDQWALWMRTFGRRQGLTAPIIYNGPVIPENYVEDEYSNITEFQKMISADVIAKRKAEGVGKGRDLLPIEVEPGKWDNSEPNIFTVYRRPLHKHPYDIGKRGTKNVVVGIVM